MSLLEKTVKDVYTYRHGNRPEIDSSNEGAAFTAPHRINKTIEATLIIGGERVGTGEMSWCCFA